MKSMNISRVFILASALAIPALYAGSANALGELPSCGACTWGAPMPTTHYFVDEFTDCYWCHTSVAPATDPVLDTTSSTATDPVLSTTSSAATDPVLDTTSSTATDPVLSTTSSVLTVTASGKSGDHRQDSGHSKAGEHRKNGKK